MAGVNGLAVGAIGAGVLLAYAGAKGYSVPAAIQNVITGKPPGSGQGVALLADQSSTGPGSTTNTPPPSAASVVAYQSYARTLLAVHGWAGQWSSFNSIVEAESGWNASALNASGAWGIAQALGHGTAATDAGNGHNQYGNFGTSDAICKAANGGSGTAQIEWMMNYITEKYGDPDKAWAYHQANGSY